MSHKIIEYECYNWNGSVTGTGIARLREDGQYDVTASYGSPWAGGICDDGPTYTDIAVQPDDWMSRFRMERMPDSYQQFINTAKWRNDDQQTSRGRTGLHSQPFWKYHPKTTALKVEHSR